MATTRFSSLETSRLLLRRFTQEDLPTLIAYRNDPVIARYQSWEAVDEPAARAFIEEQQLVEPGTPGEWFQFAIELKASGEHIGDCALHVQKDRREAEVGYTLAQAFQGHGFATEALEGLLAYCFEKLQLQRVVAIIDCENTLSIALLERVGMRREAHLLRNIFLKGRWCDEYVYALFAEEWRGK